MNMSRTASPKILFAVLLMPLLVLPVTAQSRRGGGQSQRGRSGPGTGNPEQQLPPWLYVEKGTTPPITTPLVLYWLPTSPEEMDHSPLLGSRALLEESASCVALEAIVPYNQSMVEKLGVAGKLPIAVLVDRQGNVVGRVENAAGVLRSPPVEQMVSKELNARNEAMYRDITEAKRRADSGDKSTAIDLYRRIWDDRCIFPLAGREAQKALKTLGVVVQEVPAPPPADPSLAAPPPANPKPGHAPAAPA
jgi:hypothetical protein